VAFPLRHYPEWFRRLQLGSVGGLHWSNLLPAGVLIWPHFGASSAPNGNQALPAGDDGQPDLPSDGYAELPVAASAIAWFDSGRWWRRA